MYYYQTSFGILCSRVQEQNSEWKEITEEAAKQAEILFFYDHRSGGKQQFCISHPAYFAEQEEGLWCLDTHAMDIIEQRMQNQSIPNWLLQRAREGRVTGVCAPLLRNNPSVLLRSVPKKKVIHILAMGDVGSTLLLGLSLLGGDCIAQIGIYDFNEALCQRWEKEINQISYPMAYDALPPVRVLEKEELFQCDVFLFCASKGVPPLDSKVQDVRMAQLEANAEILCPYGVLARETGFQGLFAVVSDPVDPLCQRLWDASNRNTDGLWDGKGLRPEQIQGYGLGVMNSRAAYFAKQEERFASFLTEGRAYGPHGKDLLIVNSIEHYDPDVSDALTQKAVQANLEIRNLGYKPYVAPAISSAAIAMLLTLRGEWHYSSNFLNGIYLGSRNRTTVHGVEVEALPLPEVLMRHLERIVEILRSCNPRNEEGGQS